MTKNKYNLLIVFITFLCFKLQSQDSSKIYVYEVKKHAMNIASSNIGFDITVEGILDKEELKEYLLVVKENKSVFHEKNFEQVKGYNLLFSSLTTNGIDTLYVDKSAGKYVQKKRFRNKDTLIIQSDLPKINWKILDEEKVINGFKCKKALARIEANNEFYESETLEAWFTTELSDSVAPEKYFGLPGGIVDLKTKERDYTLFAVDTSSAKSYTVKPPSSEKPSTQKQLITMLKEYLKNRGH